MCYFIKIEARTHNSTFAIGGVSCSADSFVIAESSVVRTNICGKKSAHRGIDGLYEIRVKQGSDIFRIFCFFDEDQLVVLANGY